MKYLNVYYTVLTDYEHCQEDIDEPTLMADENFCKDYLLNCLSDRLAETYGQLKTAKEIWDGLDNQFKKEEEMSKTHLVDKFMGFKFQDDKTVFPQVMDLENLVSKLNNEKIPICEKFLSGSIIYKLPLSWLSFKTEMYRKKVQVGIDDLKRFIRIEDENRARNNLELVSKQMVAANMVMESKKNPKSQKSKTKTSKGEPKQLEVKKKIKKRNGKYFNCNKWGHFAADCTAPPKMKTDKPKENVNMVIENVEPVNFVAMVVGNDEVSSTPDWCLYSRATCHVRTDGRFLADLKDAKETVLVADGKALEVTPKGTAKLTFSSGNNKTGGDQIDFAMDEDNLLDEE